VQVDGSQIIVATGNYGNAKAFVGTTTEKIKELLLPLIDKDIVPVITESFGLTKKGELVILGSNRFYWIF
jgi:aspartokinase